MEAWPAPDTKLADRWTQMAFHAKGSKNMAVTGFFLCLTAFFSWRPN
jgi:hypothetical protein